MASNAYAATWSQAEEANQIGQVEAECLAAVLSAP